MRKILITIIAVIGVGLLGGFYYHSHVQDQQQAKALLEEAIKYIPAKQYDLALDRLNKSIALDPNTISYTLRGMTYRLQNNLDAAEKDLQMALQTYPKHTAVTYYRVVPFEQLQQVHFLKGDFAAALQDDAQILAIDPTYADAVITRHIDRLRTGENDTMEFTPAMAAAKSDAWQAAVLSFYAGKLSADDLFKSAANPDAKVQSKQICAADFYIGEFLLPVSAAKAKPWFLAGSACQHFIYQAESASELKCLP